MTISRERLRRAALENAPLILLAVLFVSFGLRVPKFLDVQNLLKILQNASVTAIVAVGMTFVLLASGIDLAVGSVMFLSAAVAGKLFLAGTPLPLGLLAFPAVGLACGALHALFVTRFRVLPFVVTLSTLYAARGLGLWLTGTRDMKLPEPLRDVVTQAFLGVPCPVWAFAAVLAIAHGVLTRTPFGRQLYAVGHDPEAARKAGIAVGRVQAGAYLICGLCAAVGGLVYAAQLGTVSPSFAERKEFDAIATAVLGGVSLFGGRGRVFPGILIGAALIETVRSGLTGLGIDHYLLPLATAAIIFLAVWIDAVRNAGLQRLARRTILSRRGAVHEAFGEGRVH